MLKQYFYKIGKNLQRYIDAGGMASNLKMVSSQENPV